MVPIIGLKCPVCAYYVTAELNECSADAFNQVLEGIYRGDLPLACPKCGHKPERHAPVEKPLN